jgi:PAS domain S-box-containing protein
MSAPAAGEAVPGLHRAEGLEESLDLEGRVIGILEEGVIVCDRDGVPVLANERAVELTGMPFAALVAGAQRAPGEGVGGGQVWPAVLEALRAGEGERPAVEGTGMRSDGSEFPFEARILSLQAGEHHFSVAVIEDISKHRAAERRLADARDDALRASVVKSEFLATMSHEIRTPMNAVIGTLDLMLDCELTPELAELADIARNAANDLLVIIDDILDLSKIEADRLESRHDSFALVATVEAAADILAANALRKSVALATYIDPAIPARVRGDPRMLRQTLVNLIGNAVKFTERGEVTVHAEHVSSPAGAASVRFSVRDTGPGIPAEAVETLFEPFTQAGTHASSEQGGSGLGLAISSRLVRLMGGRLTVESELGRGSVFSFELPLERAQDEAGDETATLGPMRVLIVADAGAAAQTVALYLRDWGVTVANAPDAHTALERFSAAAADGEPFDVAIIAVGAAQADDARAAAAQLRRDAGPGGVFLIALGEVGERLSPAAGASGFDAVVTMPVKQGRLLEALAGVRPRQDGDASPAREEDPAGDGVRGLRVLIAEDNLVNQQVLMRQVHRLGLVADAVANGREVLEALERDDYDAVLMDCQMPVMDGYTAAREIRSREAGGTRHSAAGRRAWTDSSPSP